MFIVFFLNVFFIYFIYEYLGAKKEASPTLVFKVPSGGLYSLMAISIELGLDGVMITDDDGISISLAVSCLIATYIVYWLRVKLKNFF